MENSKFESWCIVELFGHQRIAGLVTEQTIGSSSFVRVDVPACGDVPEYTRFFGNGAIYAINPVAEPIARAAAAQFNARPVSLYELPELRELLGQRELSFQPDPDDEGGVF
jgi:hypothetical protein